MPTQDASEPSNTALRCENPSSFFDKISLRIEEQINASRNLFNLSKNRVGNLKRNQYAKRCRTKDLNIDRTWITSGSLGTRDSVLLFRTDILNSHNRQQGILKESSPDLTESSKSKATTSNLGNFNHPSRNLSLSLDENSFTARSSPRPLNLERTKYGKRHESTVPNSLSSSDNSFSSECEEAPEDDNNGEKPTCSKTKVDDDNEDQQENDDVEGQDETDSEFTDIPFSNEMPALQMKIKYKFVQTETKLLRKIFTRHGLEPVENDESFSILWTGIHMKADILRNLAPYQRVNHFPRSYELTRKDRLYKNIERMQHLRGLKHFDIIPQSFILPLEYRDLISAHNKYRGPWIVKPAASSRGRGIFIVTTPDQIPPEEQVLVSKYIANPLCIDGHKCDLRVYVLVTSFDPLIIYIYEEGLVRLATVKYERSAENLWNPCMHLCNYSINKYHSDYIKSNDAHDEDVGHKWTLSALLRHLKSQGCNTTQLMANIEDLIIKSIISCAQSIIAACRMFVPSGNNCFELYGFDILIDDTLKPWLLEINLSPSMGVDSPLDTKVKACLICDVLTLIGIPAYTEEMRSLYDSKWSRFRNISCTRRVVSADSVPSTVLPRRSIGGTNASSSSSTSPLTAEEQRIVRNTRLQHARRGGFVRIFPAVDSMQRYSSFLDPATGIPISTPIVQGQSSYAMILPHNFNQMLYNALFNKDTLAKNKLGQAERMKQYERVLESASRISFSKKPIEIKTTEESKELRKRLLKLIGHGSDMTQLQARQSFSLYLAAVLQRLTQEPREYHEKLILKFLNRMGSTSRQPIYYKNFENSHVISKARSAMVAKLLGDFLEQYNRETEAYVDSFDHCGMIPTDLFQEFTAHAHESDLEAVLTYHTNLTGNMPYLYNRCGLSVPPTPPIPSGPHGFIRALPSMVVTGAGTRDFNKWEAFYKNTSNTSSSESSTAQSKKRTLKR